MITTKAFATCLPVFALLAFLSGCCCCLRGMDPPSGGVQVKIEQSLTDAQNDQVEQKLKALVPDTGLSFGSTVINGQATFNLSPVADPQAFADKIDFGTVTKVEGNVIHLKVNEDAL